MDINVFIEELEKIGINVSEEQLQQLEKYYKLLIEYNKVMNLTGITEKKEVYLKHFYDSLTLNKAIELNKINSLCDIGSGAGFPGLVIKILFPEINITLVDSLNKRINFLNIVIEELGLQNISAVHSRIEDFARQNKEKYDIVTARAVAKTNILLELSMPLLKINGQFVAMKSNVEEEIININKTCILLNCSLIKKEEFDLPIENSLRTLLVFQKNCPTNEKYPRKFEQIKKNPL